MRIEQLRQGSVQVVTIVDTVTEDEAEELRAVIESAVHANAGRVVLNVARVPYVDSQGLEALLSCAASCRRAGQRLKLASVTDTLREILDITELYNNFEFFADPEQAVRSYLGGSVREVSAQGASATGAVPQGELAEAGASAGIATTAG